MMMKGMMRMDQSRPAELVSDFDNRPLVRRMVAADAAFSGGDGFAPSAPSGYRLGIMIKHCVCIVA